MPEFPECLNPVVKTGLYQPRPDKFDGYSQFRAPLVVKGTPHTKTRVHSKHQRSRDTNISHVASVGSTHAARASESNMVDYLTGPINKLRSNRQTGNVSALASQKHQVSNVLRNYIDGFHSVRKSMNSRERLSNEHGYRYGRHAHEATIESPELSVHHSIGGVNNFSSSGDSRVKR